VVAGDGMTITGAGSDRNPYVVTSNVSSIETGIDIQYNNTTVIQDVHRLDFRGTAVSIAPGTDEAVVTVTVPDPTTGIVIPTGCVFMFGMSNLPSGWLLCDGTLKSITTYPNLFAAIGTNFGGDGTSTFGVPNLMDRFPIGSSVTKPINGVSGGSTTKAIGVANLPPHAHTMNHDHPAVNTSSGGNHDHPIALSDATGTGATVRRGTGQSTDGEGPIKVSGTHLHSVDVPSYVGNTGTTVSAAGTPLDIMPPWLALAFGIKT